VLPRYDYGDAVRVVRNIRNDGTYPGEVTGELLIRRGSVGHVLNVGTFLQDQLIYSVHFLEQGRIVGCREEELIDAALPWLPSRFEPREWVTPIRPLALGGQVVARPGDRLEILRVESEEEGFFCQIYLAGEVLAIPESALAAWQERGGE
jgi:nitrogen fixation protein NifZ